MKWTVKFYDEQRNLIGTDEWHGPPGTSYFTIGMEVPPTGPPPVPGYQLTDDETAGVLDASEQRTQAHQWYHAGVPVEPALSEPIFGSDGREAGEPVLYPLTSACRCGRQITKERIDVPWIHSD